MSFTHTQTRSWSSPTGVTVTSAVTQVDEGEINFDLTIPNATTDMEVPVALDSARVKSIYILSTKDITIETNSASAPDNTLLPKADKALSWVTGDPGTAPITVDVTKLFLTNASGASATLKVRILHDLTP